MFIKFGCFIDRVPNIYGDVPKVPGTTNSRLARARSAANKAIKASSNQQAAIKQKQQAKVSFFRTNV